MANHHVPLELDGDRVVGVGAPAPNPLLVRAIGRYGWRLNLLLWSVFIALWLLLWLGV